jgi:hypothetical protein
MLVSNDEAVRRSGETVFRTSPGPHFLEIDGSGEWEVIVK